MRSVITRSAFFMGEGSTLVRVLLLAFSLIANALLECQ